MVQKCVTKQNYNWYKMHYSKKEEKLHLNSYYSIGFQKFETNSFKLSISIY